MVDWLLDPFSGGIAQRALAAAAVAGLACGPIGVWVLLYRQAYAAESMSHGMLPGLVVAALVGAPLVLGAAGGILVAAAAIALAARDERLGGDVAVAVTVTTLFGLGALLALSPEVPPRLGELLFGDLLGVTTADVAVVAGLAVVAVGVLAGGHRRLSLGAFDRSTAGSLGARASASELLLLALLGVATVAAVQALGNLLVVALVLAPAAAALNVTRRLVGALAVSAALAVACSVAGIVVSHHLEIAAGASIALACTAAFLLTLPAR